MSNIKLEPVYNNWDKFHAGLSHCTIGTLPTVRQRSVYNNTTIRGQCTIMTMSDG